MEGDAFLDIFEECESAGLPALAPWQLLIVDDESEVHHATEFALSGLTVKGRGFELLHAYSGHQAREVLARHPDIAVALLDVVMEEEDAGLQLVRYIRQDLGMLATRIVLRTGQLGYAPELEVIQQYDINDYKTKSELTRTRLATTLTAAVRSFEQIRTIDANRAGLDMIVKSGADLFGRRSTESFCDGVLGHASLILGRQTDGVICRQQGPVGAGQGETRVVGAVGRFRGCIGRPLAALGDARLASAIERAVAGGCNVYEQSLAVLYMRDHSNHEFALCLETQAPLSGLDARLIEVFAGNVSVGFENVLLLERLHTFAYFDQLTGLLNRTGFLNLIDQRIAHGRNDWVVGILDIDHFSETNDALGHENGDVLLKSVAARLRAALDEDVALARVAGDAFGLFGAVGKLDPGRIVALLAEPFPIDNYSLPVSGSLGLVRLAETGGNALDALKNANIGLNRAKSRVGGRYHYYTSKMETEMRERVRLAHDLRRSIESQQLTLHYQPQIHLASGRVVGAEALLRWRNSEGKMVPPDKFIPVAESSGLIRPIGEWVLRTAARQLRVWNERGLTAFRMAVNVSLDQFRMPGFTDLVRAVIEAHRIDPSMFELEITESMAMDDMEVMMGTLQRLKAIGAAVAIDDFGTGFSSLGYLQQLSVDRLKIDRTFVEKLSGAGPRSSIPEMIVKLGHDLGLEVIAEGVSSEDHVRALRNFGCDEGQGYLFCPPVEVAAFEQWLEGQGMLGASLASL